MKKTPDMSLFYVGKVLVAARFGHRVSVIGVVEWHESCWNHVPWIVRVQKEIRVMLFISETVFLNSTGNALAFFTVSGNVNPFSIDLSDFCRSFRVESNTLIQIFKGHDVLLINERSQGHQKIQFFGVPVRIWYKIIFWTQNRLNCKLCRIIRRELCFIVAAHRFLQMEKFSTSSISTKLSTDFWS